MASHSMFIGSSPVVRHSIDGFSPDRTVCLGGINTILGGAATIYKQIIFNSVIVQLAHKALETKVD